jgi:hypothetical protein
MIADHDQVQGRHVDLDGLDQMEGLGVVLAGVGDGSGRQAEEDRADDRAED